APGAAIERVIAGATDKDAVGTVANDHVVAAAANGVFDKGQRVVFVQQGDRDVARGHLAIAEMGALAVAEARPAAGGEVDAQIGGILREIEGVASATVPDGLEDFVVAGRAVADAIDEFFAGGFAPAIDCVLGAGAVVGAVKILD